MQACSGCCTQLSGDERLSLLPHILTQVFGRLPPLVFLNLKLMGGMGICRSGWGFVLRNYDGDSLLAGCTNTLNFANYEVEEAWPVSLASKLLGR